MNANMGRSAQPMRMGGYQDSANKENTTRPIKFSERHNLNIQQQAESVDSNERFYRGI